MGETASGRLVISPAGTLGGAGGRKYLGFGGNGGGSLRRDRAGRLDGELSGRRQPAKDTEHTITNNKHELMSFPIHHDVILR